MLHNRLKDSTHIWGCHVSVVGEVNRKQGENDTKDNKNNADDFGVLAGDCFGA